MAITRIHNIKGTLVKALEYIENPEKTDEQMLVSAYNCEPFSASIEFEMTAQLAKDFLGDTTTRGGSNNLAQHMIQSFAPWDKISAEQAHEIGKQLADEFLQGKYEYVISTHVDKGHIHNHIIFNSTSFYDFRKFDNYKVARKIREISDRLCEEHGLYVTPTKDKGKSRYEWQQRNAGTSWKAQMEASLDATILQSTSYDRFLEALQQQKIEVKDGAHIAFRMEGQTRFCRGKTLGERYTKEQIMQRIAAPKTVEPEVLLPRVERHSRRASLTQTKKLAAALLTLRQENILSTRDLEEKLCTVANEKAALMAQLKTLDSKNTEYKKVAGFLQTAHQHEDIAMRYSNQPALTKAAFESRYRNELSAYDYAITQLTRMGLSGGIDYDKVVELIRNQSAQSAALQARMKALDQRAAGLQRAFDTVQAVDREGEQLESKKLKGKGGFQI